MQAAKIEIPTTHRPVRLLEAVPPPPAAPLQLALPAAWASPPAGAGPCVEERARPLRAKRVSLPLVPEQQAKRRRQCSPQARARTINTGKFTLRERQGAYSLDLFWDPEIDRIRPKTRADCVNGPRPCPWIGCRYHLAINTDPERPSIKEVFPDLAIMSAEDPTAGLEQLQKLVGTCALDAADEMDDGTGGYGGLIALHQAAQSGRALGQTPGMTIAEAGQHLNLSIERTRQLSALAMQEVRVKLRYHE